LKFFKHFTDAHRGKSLRLLQKKFGFAGKGRYWDLVELCAEKLEKERADEFTLEHCVFEFEKTSLMRSLGYPNLTLASRYLDALVSLGLVSLDDLGDTWLVSMPKLLESLDRDTRRPRPVRVRAAPKKKNKEEEEDNRESNKENKEFEQAPNLSNSGEFDAPPLFKIWNESCGSLPKVLRLTKKRESQIKARMREEPNLVVWQKAIASLATSRFASGENKNGWRANFDFLLKPDSLTKILEGNYDNNVTRIVDLFIGQ
jgi:hypothetical protein